MSIFMNRYLIISLPAAYLLLARCITYLLPKRKPLLMVAVSSCIVVVFLLHLFFVRPFYSVSQKAQYREAVNYIVDKDPQYRGSLVIGNLKSANYYFRRVKSTARVVLEVRKLVDTPQIQKALTSRNTPYFWYIYVERPPEDELLDYLNHKFQLIDKRIFHRAGVFLYKNEID